MKKCPYCAEEIQDEAIKCKHCGSMLEKPKEKWYFSAWTLIVSFFVVGPLMLPLVWANPRYSKKEKIIISTVVIILTVIVVALFANALKRITGYYNMIM